MPQLPSGKHVAISAARLIELLESAARGERYTEVFAILRADEFDSYIDVMFFRESAGNQEQGAPGSQMIPNGLESYPSGWTLETLDTVAQGWTPEDRAAWDDYLASARVADYLDALWKQIMFRAGTLIVAAKDNGQASKSS